MSISQSLCVGIVAASLLSLNQQIALAENNPPVIRHTPATVAIQGQSMLIKATVTDDTGIKSVTLFYSTSKDVAPFRVEMQPAGPNTFVCTLPDHLLGFASTLTYYIEALDNTDQASETRWYNVSIQPATATVKVDKKTPPPAADDTEFWKRTALIGGGVALAGGAAAVIIGNSGGHSSTQAPPPAATNQYTGTYVGSITTHLDFPGQSTRTDSHGTIISIDKNGTLASSDLYVGKSLVTTLVGSSFTITANINETNRTGQITFSGSILNGRILGDVGGSIQELSGTNGTYYGNFYAVKQ